MAKLEEEMSEPDLFNDIELANAIVGLRAGEFLRGNGAPDSYGFGQYNAWPVEYFVQQPAVALKLMELVVARYWQIHPSTDHFGQYLCMVIKVQRQLRSPYESHNMAKAIIMACVDALIEDPDQ